MKIFGDAIDDKIFPKEIKRFTAEEKSLIDKFINSILREDKKSELEKSEIEIFNDRRDRITEEIYKDFVFKGVSFHLRFSKIYTNEKKTIEWLPSDEFSLSALLYDGYTTIDFSPTESLLKDFADDKSITGIFVKGYDLDFIMKSRYKVPGQYKIPGRGHDLLGIRTKYEDARGGGFHLTTKCKNHIEKVHLKIIKDAILKATKSKKKK